MNHRLDIHTLQRDARPARLAHERHRPRVARARSSRLRRSVRREPRHRRFILIDEVTNQTVAAGLIEHDAARSIWSAPGPGAPDLLTLRAARLLERADIVFTTRWCIPATLALAARARKVAVGKRCGQHSTAQRFINKRCVDAARTALESSCA